MPSRFLASGFIDAGSADVAHPFDGVLIAVVELGLEYFEIADFEARRREGDFEIHGNGRPRPLLLLVGQQLDLGRDLGLLEAAHALDLPHDGVLRGLVLGLALHTDKLDAAGVGRGGDAYLHLLSDERWLEVGFDHHFDLHLGLADLAHQRNHPERQADVVRRSVAHQLIFPIGRNEADRVLRFKLA